MLSSLASLILGALAKLLVDLFNARQANQNTIALGQQQQQNADLKGQIDGINKANAAREAVRADLGRNAGHLSDDDGFRRD